MNLLYDNKTDTTVLDLYITPEIVGNVLNDRIHFLQLPENLVQVSVSDVYKYRPERVALQYYGNESYYPIILAANNIGTLFHFVPSKFNNTINMVKSDVLRQLFNI
jgi:hypothetical protein